MKKDDILKNLSSHKLKELKGFEELLDVAIEDVEERQKKARQRELEKQGEIHELYNFLEREIDRLTTLDRLFGHQIPNLTSHPQGEQLKKNQLKRREQLLETLTARILEDDSIYLKNLEQIYNSVFKH